VIGTLAVDGWAVTFGTARTGPGRAAAPRSSLLARYTKSTASVPTSYRWHYKYLCPLKGLRLCCRRPRHTYGGLEGRFWS